MKTYWIYILMRPLKVEKNVWYMLFTCNTDYSAWSEKVSNPKSAKQIWYTNIPKYCLLQFVTCYLKINTFIPTYKKTWLCQQSTCNNRPSSGSTLFAIQLFKFWLTHLFAIMDVPRYKSRWVHSKLCLTLQRFVVLNKICAYRNKNKYPAGTWRKYNVASTSMQRHDVA